MTRKRKELDETEAEHSRKRKKKKKQVLTPRPACSWVYFSREFIREYSAAHPESSGLKVATKAASDAWRIMSDEEKSKYTKRAREVWDNYLSSTPARPPKPRKQTSLVTRCSPGRVFNVIKHLTPEQNDAVKSLGLGSLLHLRCRTLRRSLCLWLLERFNTARRSLEICGRRIHLSPKLVELVMGLSSTGKHVMNSGPDEMIAGLRQKYNATNRGISVRLLEEQLSAPDYGEDFKRSFVLYALGTLLCPTARLDVSPSFLHFLIDMDIVCEYNWGKFLLDRLVREVSRFRQGKQRAVGGCLLFLQLFYYESIAVEGHIESSHIVIPCLSAWGEEEITEREKLERELGGYGCGEVIWDERCRDSGILNNNTRNDDMLPFQELTTTDMDPDSEAEVDEENTDLIREDEENTATTNSEGENQEESEEIEDYLYSQTSKYPKCLCPITDCNFTGSTRQLSVHVSSEHWNLCIRFHYNTPMFVSIGKKDKFLVLEEENGTLFLLNKKTIKNTGFMINLSRISAGSARDKEFLYDIIAERDTSSLRLKSCDSLMDFLVVPFGYCSLLGKIDLEICIWSSKESGT